ncbi:MAG: glycosyltransferase family 9 protein [Candidatus Omnitrophica bacterium]|nr:glycosyltransferase family 9 protein [Candidatus Omnitrophota bacterium]
MKIKQDKKVLIIKLGYSETLDSTLSLTTSLGDVLRTTVILHFFKDCNITWLVDEKALPLLEKNKFIDKILVYNSDTVFQLRKEKFDIIINLEKVPEICKLSDSLVAGECFGFGAGGSKRLIELTQDLNKKKQNKHCWQVVLAEVLGKKWEEEEYVLGYEPAPEIKYDIGFNWTTGPKWKNKAWPKNYWERLERLVGDKYSISWQKGLDSISEYIDWMNSCRLIITADSLGLHLGLALKKRVIALFGPTSHHEIYFYNRGSFLLPEAPYKCMPCLKSGCDKKKQCMEYISPEMVLERIKSDFKPDTSS